MAVLAGESLKNKDVINVCFSSDNNYARYLALSLATILDSKEDDDNLHFYILDGGLSEDSKRKILNLKKIADFDIDFISVDEEKFNDCPLEQGARLTRAAYYRLLIPDLVPDVDKILYMDCDIQVKSSLKELFSSDIKDYYLAAVEDIDEVKNSNRLNLKKYFNSGVLLLNLAKFREINFTSKIFDWIALHKDQIVFHDQDVLNLYFADNVKFLDKKWNLQGILKSVKFRKEYKEGNLIHFIVRGKSDFVFMAFPIAMKTDYKIEFLRLFLSSLSSIIGRNIFNVRNEDDYKKVITLLGIQIIIPRKKK